MVDERNQRIIKKIILKLIEINDSLIEDYNEDQDLVFILNNKKENILIFSSTEIRSLLIWFVYRFSNVIELSECKGNEFYAFIPDVTNNNSLNEGSLSIVFAQSRSLKRKIIVYSKDEVLIKDDQMFCNIASFINQKENNVYDVKIKHDLNYETII